jgi:hypothetical protein
LQLDVEIHAAAITVLAAIPSTKQLFQDIHRASP